MRRFGTTVVAAIVAVGLASGAYAATIVSYTDCVTLSTTNWLDCLTVPQFNPALGTLQKITVELQGHVQGSAAFESQDCAPATVTMNLQATITLNSPTGLLAQVVPLVSTSDCATIYDGVPDFGGTSGKTYSGLSADCSTSAFKVPAFTAPWDAFIGTGNVDMPTTAAGTSNGSGAGNLLLSFSTDASAIATVTYEYDAVPEPATMTLLGSGVLGMIGWIRRRRMK